MPVACEPVNSTPILLITPNPASQSTQNQRAPGTSRPVGVRTALPAARQRFGRSDPPRDHNAIFIANRTLPAGPTGIGEKGVPCWFHQVEGESYIPFGGLDRLFPAAKGRCFQPCFPTSGGLPLCWPVIVFSRKVSRGRRFRRGNHDRCPKGIAAAALRRGVGCFRVGRGGCFRAWRTCPFRGEQRHQVRTGDADACHRDRRSCSCSRASAVARKFLLPGHLL